MTGPEANKNWEKEVREGVRSRSRGEISRVGEKGSFMEWGSSSDSEGVDERLGISHELLGVSGGVIGVWKERGGKPSTPRCEGILMEIVRRGLTLGDPIGVTGEEVHWQGSLGNRG